MVVAQDLAARAWRRGGASTSASQRGGGKGGGGERGGRCDGGKLVAATLVVVRGERHPWRCGGPISLLAEAREGEALSRSMLFFKRKGEFFHQKGEISFRETSGLEVVWGTFFSRDKRAHWVGRTPRNRPAGTYWYAGAEKAYAASNPAL